MWTLPAAAAALRIVRSERPDAIMTTSPEESSHLVGMIVSAVTGLPWVAEFRDGWRFQSLRGDLSDQPVRRAVEHRMEWLTCTRADALIGVTPPIADDLQARFGKGVWISNGWDDVDVDPAAEREAAQVLSPDAFNLLYTGTFSASRYSQSPGLLAAAMRLLADQPATRGIRLTIVGALPPRERAAFADIPTVRLIPHQPRRFVLALQPNADALVLVTPPGDPSIATGKLFEYIGAARPIVALAAGNEAARLVTELKVGVVVTEDDAASIADAIAALAARPPALPDLDSPAIRRFHRQALTGELVTLLERVSRGR
jgi:glycosyltransferase involved in cell wall biosynthesis